MRGTACRDCGAQLETGVLRCRHCGADARRPATAPGGVSFTFDLDELLEGDERLARLFAVIERLNDLAPKLMAWKRSDRTRPAPKIPPGCVAEVLRLLTEAEELLAKRR